MVGSRPVMRAVPFERDEEWVGRKLSSLMIKARLLKVVVIYPEGKPGNPDDASILGELSNVGLDGFVPDLGSDFSLQLELRHDVRHKFRFAVISCRILQADTVRILAREVSQLDLILVQNVHNRNNGV